jgi:hypothetical protein
MVEKELNIYKDLNNLRYPTLPDSIYFVLNSETKKVSQIWVTSNQNVPKQVELGSVRAQDLISTDVGNNIGLGTDAKLFSVGGNSANLNYVPNNAFGAITNTGGTGVILPLANTTDAGLLKPSKFTLLEQTTEAFTTALKSLYDGAVALINSHVLNTSNPHNTTAAQVGAPSGSGTSTGSNTGDNANNTTSNAYADAKVADTITDGVTTIAPSQNAVFLGLSNKVDKDGIKQLSDENYTLLEKQKLAGLQNFDNTANETAIANKQNLSEKNQFGGYVGIGADGNIKLDAYPNTRNDGQLSTNKVLSTDANGNLRLFTIATSPPPFLEVLIPDSTLPSTTTNFTLKGAFFTPTMTVAIVGQTINYTTFISDNEVDVNVTTSATEGSYAVTLNNGLSATFPNALLIVLGTVFTPTSADFTILSGTADLTEAGNFKKNFQTSDAIAEVYNVPINQNFQFRWQENPSPFLTNTYTDGETYIEIYQNGVRRYSFIYLYGPARIRTYQPSTGDTIEVSYDFTFNNNTIYYFQRIGSQMIIKGGNTVITTFTDLSNTGNIVFRIRNKNFDIVNIKYIELA